MDSMRRIQNVVTMVTLTAILILLLVAAISCAPMSDRLTMPQDERPKCQGCR